MKRLFPVILTIFLVLIFIGFFELPCTARATNQTPQSTVPSSPQSPQRPPSPQPDSPPAPQPATLPGAVQPNAPQPEAMTDIHDIKPPEEIGFDPRILYFAAAALGVLLLAVVLFFLWQKFKNRKKKRSFVILSAHERAFQRLDELTAVEDLEGKTFYFQLSSVLREYIENRFGVNALEMTTEEFLPKIDTLSVEQDLKKGIRTLCLSTDPVKFAGVPGVVEQMRKDLMFVRNFVKTTTQAETQDAGDKNAEENTGAAA